MSFDIVRAEPISRQVYAQLRQRLLNGEIAPDTPLVEGRIAKELNVSRTPVREAILLLEAEGLVKVLPNGRTVAVDLLSQLEEILGIREALECYAARRALEHINPREVARLEAICKEAEATPLADVERRSELNREFHALIVGAARNNRLTKAIDDYRGYFRIAHYVYDAEMAEESFAEHRLIVEAIKNREAETLEEVIRRHLHRAVRTIRNRLVRQKRKASSEQMSSGQSNELIR